jgi:tRNA(adenine34) deaminase
MRRALQLAEQAESEGEVPVGAVVVKGDRAVGEGWNQVVSLNDPTAHAEIVALRAAGQSLGNYRLPGCRMYVTLEPCAMCLGALLHARFEQLLFAAPDPKTGAAGGAFEMPAAWAHNHRIEIEGGILAEESAELLRAFFRARRGTAGRDSDRQL